MSYQKAIYLIIIIKPYSIFISDCTKHLRPADKRSLQCSPVINSLTVIHCILKIKLLFGGLLTCTQSYIWTELYLLRKNCRWLGDGIFILIYFIFFVMGKAMLIINFINFNPCEVLKLFVLVKVYG